MSRRGSSEPKRWSSGAGDAPPDVAEGLRSVRRQTQEVAAAKLARIRTRVNDRVRPRPVAPRRFAWAAAVVLLFLGAGVASAVVLVQRKSSQNDTTPLAPAAEPRLGGDRHKRATRELPAQSPPEQPPEAPPDVDLGKDMNDDAKAPASPPARAHTPGPARRAPPSVEPNLPRDTEVEVAPEALAPDEAAMLAKVVQALRRQRDPRAALSELDAYEARFPAGVFRSEAIVARTEALLTLGERDEALAQVDPLDLGSLPRARPLALLRAELRAAKGRCADALVDFTAAVSAKADAVTERALRGRAVCKARVGDEAGAAADMKEHADRFKQSEGAQPKEQLAK